MRSNWLGTQYNTILKNCNSFSKSLIGVLLEDENYQLPAYVDRMDRMVRLCPLMGMIPDEYTCPVALEESMRRDAGDQGQAAASGGKLAGKVTGKRCSKVVKFERGGGKMPGSWRGKEGGGKSRSKNAGAGLPIFKKVATRAKDVVKEAPAEEGGFEETDVQQTNKQASGFIGYPSNKMGLLQSH